MRVRLILPGAALLALAGCFSCGGSPESATWQDPALFDAMPPPMLAGNRHSVWTPPGAGLPFATAFDPAWGPTNLTSVGLQTEAPPYDPVTVTLVAYALTASRVNVTAEAVVAATAERFLANATTLSLDEREAIIADLLASAHVEDRGYFFVDEAMRPVGFVAYAVPVPNGLRLDDLHSDLTATGNHPMGPGGFQSGPWTFGFSQAKRSLDTDKGRLDVSSTGEAVFQGHRGDRSEGAYERHVRSWLAEEGLPGPTEMVVHSSIC